MKRRSVDGEGLVTHEEDEVWMQRALRTEMAHALEAWQSQHFDRCCGDDAVVRDDVVECVEGGWRVCKAVRVPF